MEVTKLTGEKGFSHIICLAMAQRKKALVETEDIRMFSSNVIKTTGSTLKKEIMLR